MGSDALPAELADALDRAPGASERWAALTERQRRDHAAHVADAVREDTRRRRAERCVDTLVRSARSGTRRGAPLARIPVVLRGTDLPGRSCAPDRAGHPCDDVHVGLRRGSAVVERVPGDADVAEWRFELEIHRDADGVLDFGGPSVLGPPMERHLVLVWQARDRLGHVRGFRAAKLRLVDVDPAVVDGVLRDGGTLVATLGLTDECGLPRCATVPAPLVEWRQSAT